MKIITSSEVRVKFGALTREAPEDISVRLERFFADLAENQSCLEAMDDDVRAAFIKDPN